MIALGASQAHSWGALIWYVGLLLGGGSMVYLLQQWRSEGSRLARNWLLPAFGAWGAAVFVMSSSQAAGYVIICLGLLAGVIGAVTVSRRRQESHS